MEVGEDFNIKVTFSTLLGMKGTQRDSEAFLVQVCYIINLCFPGGKNLHCPGLEIVVFSYIKKKKLKLVIYNPSYVSFDQITVIRYGQFEFFSNYIIVMFIIKYIKI